MILFASSRFIKGLLGLLAIKSICHHRKPCYANDQMMHSMLNSLDNSSGELEFSLTLYSFYQVQSSAVITALRGPIWYDIT